MQRNYDETAHCYAGKWADQLAEHGRKLAVALPLSSATAVLDLGCGPGRLLAYLAGQAPGARLVGADATEAMLAFAPRRFLRVVSDAQRLPFSAGTFDVVLLSFVLFHLADPFAGLSEIRRVLRPGGAVGVLTWGETQPFAAYDLWLDCVEATGAPPDPRPMLHTVLDSTSANAMAQALAAAGFAEIAVTSRRFTWHPTAEEFLEHSLGIGAAARRLALLPPDARQACIATARQRLVALPAKAFRREATVLHTLASAAGAQG